MSRIQSTSSTSSSFVRPGKRAANVLHEEDVKEVEMEESRPRPSSCGEKVCLLLPCLNVGGERATLFVPGFSI